MERKYNYVKKPGKRSNLAAKVQKAHGPSKSPKFKESVFNISINTNQRFTSDDPQLYVWAERLEAACDKLQDIDILESMIKLMKDRDPDASLNKINHIESEYVTERGKRYDQLHAHFVVLIRHTTFVQMDATKLREFFKGELRLDGIHVHVTGLSNKFKKSLHEILIEYINKNVE